MIFSCAGAVCVCGCRIAALIISRERVYNVCYLCVRVFVCVVFFNVFLFLILSMPYPCVALPSWRSICLFMYLKMRIQTFWIRWWIIISLFIFFYSSFLFIHFFSSVISDFHWNFPAFRSHSWLSTPFWTAACKEFMPFIIFHTIHFRFVSGKPSASTAHLNWAMHELIGCALSDWDIDHNSNVLNAFYLFIEHIHFVCLKHITGGDMCFSVVANGNCFFCRDWFSLFFLNLFFKKKFFCNINVVEKSEAEFSWFLFLQKRHHYVQILLKFMKNTFNWSFD